MNVDDYEVEMDALVRSYLIVDYYLSLFDDSETCHNVKLCREEDALREGNTPLKKYVAL